MKSKIDTTRTAGANFSCLLCLRRQMLQKIYTSNTVATLKCFNYRTTCHIALNDKTYHINIFGGGSKSRLEKKQAEKLIK